MTKSSESPKLRAMKIVDAYTPFMAELSTTRSIERAIRQTAALSPFASRAEAWGADWRDVEEWMTSTSYPPHAQNSAQPYLQIVSALVKKVESVLGVSALPGELHLIPSCKAFDGFARYDRGHHTVLLGIDFPDASLDYLKALTAHELSHVYRDHQPEVWGFLGKPLREVTRDEYLESSTAHEHLVSEGLATLFSQKLFPEIPASIHHYYEDHEWNWCLQNHSLIHEQLTRCLRDPNDQDVWRFYGEDRVSPGSPSRTQYYWASHQIQRWLQDASLSSLIQAHSWNALRFECFNPDQRA